MFYFILTLLLVVTALAKEDESYDPDPKLNWRPGNVTDLTYYLYPYIGSYYNGTTSFRLSPKDWGSMDDDTVCTNFRDRDIIFSFDSLVAIVKPNEYDAGANPIMLLAKSWPENLNLTPAGGNEQLYPSQINDFAFRLESISPKTKGYDDPVSVSDPKWNLTTKYLSDTSYSLAGSADKGTNGVEFNMSQCTNTSESWWGAVLLYEKDVGRYNYNLLNVTNPILSGRFNNQSASFIINGFFHANADPALRPESELAGEISIEFLGQLDTARSDTLVFGQSKPEWIPTIGFSKSTVTGTGDNTSDGARRRTGVLYTYGFFYFLYITVSL